MKSILFLEDDARLRKSLALDFEDRGYRVFEAASLKEIPTQEKLDYAVLDLRLAGENGLHGLQKVLELHPGCRVLILTGYGSIATAVEAMKLGAVNYLTKPASSEMIELALQGGNAGATPVVPNEILPLSKKEHEYIEFVLTQNDGNISKTARALGLHRQSLQRKLKKFP